MTLYAGLISLIFFYMLKHMDRFRISETIEVAGMDILDNGIGLDEKILDTKVTKRQILHLGNKQRKTRAKYGMRVKDYW